MFVREHQNQFRGAQADVQRFYGAVNRVSNFRWNKPIGVSFVYIMLIGGGGGGNGSSTGGGCGSVSVWFGAAKSIPNSLRILINSTSTSIIFNGTSAATTIMTSAAASTSTGGAVTTSNGYWAQGFYNFTAGIDGVSADVNPQPTTFLSPGGSGSLSTANYGYSSGSNGSGYFLFSPIIVGVSEGGSKSTAAAYGCGSYAIGPTNTPGLALIASW